MGDRFNAQRHLGVPMNPYFRAWVINKEQGGIDFVGKYPTFREAMQHGEFCDYIDGDGVHMVLDSGRIIY